MGTVSFAGEILARPNVVSESTFPGGRTEVALSLTPTTKSANVLTGVQVRTIASPNAFVELSGVGATDTVTQSNFLYLRTNAPMDVRVTMKNGVDPDTVSTVYVNGLLIMEFDSARYLNLIEVKGAGQVEWFSSGNQ
jgi:hypothetical protein